MKYLYGASVQGIQDFIFRTNELQDMVGASEIVKSINDEFEKKYKDRTDVEIILNAAGNIKAVFEDKETIQKHILDFEKDVMQKAYGITISQAVVEFDKEPKNFINDLEKRLKIQRNRPSIPLDSSINIMKLNPTTAKPMITNKVDIATKQKINAYNDMADKTNSNIGRLSNSKNKIAVIHIDGNGLGQLIPKLKMPLSEFSQKLDSATQEAFNKAKEGKKIRQIVVGGDDVTIICNANDALSFSNEFLSYFEEKTKQYLGDKLTACGGIAYANKKYPFHYAVSLAEELCTEAKKYSKKINEDLAPSCMMFHNIQSSNVQSWDKFVEDELTIVNDMQTIKCNFGPYYLNESNQPLIKDFLNTLEAYRCDGSPISRLRNWLSELHKSDKYASNLLQRINEITQQSKEWDSCIMDRNLKNIDQELSNENLIIKKDGELKTPIYDIIQVLSITDKRG
jgi:CRISPR/Cas system-associated protein Cas10 (large subunit of type III CRISPR-Cas system)